jgi:phage-related protein
MLPDTLVARYLKLTDLMQKYGPNLGMPHTRALGNGLFEMRLKAKEGIARVFYCTLIGNNIFVLHVFIKKTEQTPLKELRLAKMRMKEVKKNG